MPNEKKESDSTTKEDVLYKLAKFFMESGDVAHITLKKIDETSGKHIFSNGFIVEVYPDFLMINDRIDGVLAFFFLEIDRISNYRDKKIEGAKDGKGR